MINIINSKVYEDGVNTTLKNTFAFLLMTDNDETVGYSACIDNTKENKENYLSERLSWDKENKAIKISSFGFEETKTANDLQDLKEERIATNFAIVTLDKTTDISETPSAAYEDSKSKYYWPNFNSAGYAPSEDQILFKGLLETPVNVQANNNFKIKETEIRFSEVQNI